MGLSKLEVKKGVYFGHPAQFWRERQRLEMEPSIDIEEMKKLTDVVDYDAVHMQKLIINRAEEKLRQIFKREELNLCQRKIRLKELLEEEEEQYILEIQSRKALEDCGYCKERDARPEKIEEEIEKQKVGECQKALEREKIAKGMPRTREDERRLRDVQKMQVLERRYQQQEEQDLEVMWHRVLLDDVRKKERLEKREEDRRRKEMIERRNAYDEQIANANRKRQEMIREERERENRKLEKMKKKMEQDHYDAIKRKKEQQMTIKQNYIEGHEDKIARVRQEKQIEREIDNQTIRTALEELRREKLRKVMEMRNLQIEKQVFTENIHREKKLLDQLEIEGDRVAAEWKQLEEQKADKWCRNVEEERRMTREAANQEYRRLIEERNKRIEREREERRQRMDLVRRSAICEIQRKLDNTNEAIRKQIQYRNVLRNQIMENQRCMESDANEFEYKDKPFTRKAEMFKDIMTHKYRMSSARSSTNPVHPFKRQIDALNAGNATLQLPSIE